MTDTADYADIVLPATSQLEHTDLHKAYGHTLLSLNVPAIEPLAEAKSNWRVMRLLAAEMGFEEAWLKESEETIIHDLLTNSLPDNPHLAGITLERLRDKGSMPMHLPNAIPFADGRFRTPDGKVALYCPEMIADGVDPLPQYVPAVDDSRPSDGGDTFADDAALNLISGAAHHYVTSSMANHQDLRRKEGEPLLEIHPDDAAARNILDGQDVIVENRRGWCRLKARVSDAVRPGVVSSPKGHWLKHHGGRNINFTTSDAIGDLAGQSTFHTNRVWVRPGSAT